MNFNRAIRLIRAKKGISQQEFAKITNINPSLISRIESGERLPSRNNIKSISESLHIPVNLVYLLASEKNDFKNLPEKEVKKLSHKLLKILLSN